MEEKRSQIGEWILWRVITWGLGALVGLAVAAFLLPRPGPEVIGITAIGPARVSWGFIATLAGCLALGLMLWKDPSWGNKVAWALSVAIAVGVIAPEEARMIASIVAFVIPVVIMIIKVFFGREHPSLGIPAAVEAPVQPAGIGFQAGIGLGGAEQIDLASILRDRERAATDSASAQLLQLCDQLAQRGGRIGGLADVLGEQILTEQLGRRGIQIRVAEAEAVPQEEPRLPRRQRLRSLLRGGKSRISRS